MSSDFHSGCSECLLEIELFPAFKLHNRIPFGWIFYYSKSTFKSESNSRSSIRFFELFSHTRIILDTMHVFNYNLNHTL